MTRLQVIIWFSFVLAKVPMALAEPNLDASLYWVENLPRTSTDQVWRSDFLDGKEVNREAIVRLNNKFRVLGRFTEPIVDQRYAISSDGLIIDLKEKQVIRGDSGSLLGVVDGSVVSISHGYNEKGAFPVTSFQLKARQESLVFETDDSRVGILSPDGSRVFQSNHGMIASPQFISVANGLTTRIRLQSGMIHSSSSSSFPKPAALWLDNETILMSQTNSTLVTVTIEGKVDRVADIPELDPGDSSGEGFGTINSKLAIGYSLFRDPAGNIVYHAGHLGAFAINVAQQSYAPYHRYQISNEFSSTHSQFGYAYGEETPDIFYRNEKIGRYRARQRMATSGYLALNDHENRLSWWSTKSRQWKGSHLHVDTLIGWVDYRKPLKDTETRSLTRPARVEPLIIHEWGVQVIGDTSIRIDDPESIWSPGGLGQLGPPNALLDHLPDFVERPEYLATNLRSTGMWDKPVIHVYGGVEGQSINVNVETPLGVPLAYYPRPQELQRKETRMSYYQRLMQADSDRLHGLDWKMTLHTSDAPLALLEPPDGHWWSRVRKVPSRYLKTRNGNERFLFYEATAQAGAPLTLVHNNGRLTARWIQSQEAGAAANAEGYQANLVAILNDDGHYRLGWARQFGGDVAKAQQLEVSEFDDVRSPTQILQACRRQWQNAGMTFREADAIVETWKDDLLGTPGMLCTYVIPRAMYDAMFPVTIEPEPDVIVRVGMIFQKLPLNFNALPKLKTRLDQLANAFEHGSETERSNAKEALLAHRVLTQSYLSQIRDRSPRLQEFYGTLIEQHGKQFPPPKTKVEQPVVPGPEWFRPARY